MNIIEKLNVDPDLFIEEHIDDIMDLLYKDTSILSEVSIL